MADALREEPHFTYADCKTWDLKEGGGRSTDTAEPEAFPGPEIELEPVFAK
jgi:hypothetical protein